VADDVASGAALVTAPPAGATSATGRLQRPSAAAAGTGSVATPAARLVAAGDAAWRAALVAAPPAGAAGPRLQPSAAAAGADSAAFSRRTAAATAQIGNAFALMSFDVAAGGRGGRPTGGLAVASDSSVARLVAGAAEGAVLCFAAAGATATSAVAAAEARGACNRNAAGYQRELCSEHAIHAEGGLERVAVHFAQSALP